MPDLSSIVLPNNTEVTLKDPNAYHPTQAQLAALNSGITSTDVAQIQTNTDNLGDVQTAIENLLQPPVINALSVTDNGTYTPTTGVDGFAPVTVNVQSYSSADAGKVVNAQGTALVSQTAYPSTVTTNATIDTTYHNSVTVNVNSVGHTVNITTIPNATVTLSKTGKTYTATADNSGSVSFNAVDVGTYTVTATIDDAVSDSTSVTVTDFSATEDSFATLTVSASDNCTITVTDGTITKTLSYTGTPIVQYVSLGTWTVSTTIDSTLITRTVSVSSYTNQSVYLSPVSSVTRQVNFATSTTSITDGTIESVTTFSGMRRCNVADDGTINAFYGDASYTEDGTNGQVMVYVPKFYYKVNHTNSSGAALSNGAAIDIGNWSIADGPLAGYSVHPAFINANNEEVDYFLIGAFEAVFQNGSTYTSSYDSSYKMASSKGSGSLKPGASFTRANGRTTATARGTGWYQCGIKQISAVQMLMTVEYGCNSQTAIGQGYTNSNNSASTYVGQTTGNGTSDHSGDTSAVVYRGIENLWGNVYKWIDGLTLNGRQPYINTGYSFSDNYDGSALSFTVPTSNNYITRFGYDSTFDWVFLPKASGSSTAAIGDYMYQSSSTYRVAYLGGNWSDGSYAGFFSWGLNNGSSASNAYFGSRIMFIP